MGISFRRFFDEFFLYSSQFVVFFILMLFITPSADSLRPAALLIVGGFLVIQIPLLVRQGHKPLLRVLFSFITPVGYVLVRTLTGTFQAYDMANIFLWGSALYVGLFQAISIAGSGRGIKRFAEGLLAFGAVIIFVFFYFYLDLRLGLARRLAAGMITQIGYQAALDIRSFPPAFLDFLESPQNGFMILGAGTFGIMILGSRVKIIGLRARISRLFNSTHRDDKATEHDGAIGQAASVTVISADIRDFMGLTELVSADRAVAILNRYYSLWAVAAERHGGSVSGVAADSVLIVFGLLGEKDAAARALASALDFLAELPGLRDDLVSASLPALTDVSIGIHSGTIVAGELGLAGSRRLAVFGEAVSVATRLDSLCREFKQDLLLSQPVFRQLALESQSKLVKIGEVLVRNSTQPLPVYGRK